MVSTVTPVREISSKSTKQQKKAVTLCIGGVGVECVCGRVTLNRGSLATGSARYSSNFSNILQYDKKCV